MAAKIKIKKVREKPKEADVTPKEEMETASEEADAKANEASEAPKKADTTPNPEVSDVASAQQDVPKIIMPIRVEKPVFRIVFAIVIAVLFLGFPQFMGFWSSETSFVPIFDLTFLSSVWYLVVIWSLARIIGEVLKIIIGRYNRLFALVAFLSDAGVVIAVALMFLNPSILNPYFIPILSSHFEVDVPHVVELLITNINLIIFAIVCFVTLIDFITTLIKSLKYN